MQKRETQKQMMSQISSDTRKQRKKREIKRDEKTVEKIEKIEKVEKSEKVEKEKSASQAYDLEEDLKPKQWTQVQYEMFFEALKEHGLNFTKIAEAIGSNRFIVSTFFKQYSERKNLPCHPLNQPVWNDEEREKVVQIIEANGEDYDLLHKAVPDKSRHAISSMIKRITEKFNAKEDLTEFEQKLILALHKPNTVVNPEPKESDDKLLLE